VKPKERKGKVGGKYLQKRKGINVAFFHIQFFGLQIYRVWVMVMVRVRVTVKTQNMQKNHIGQKVKYYRL